MSPQDFVQKIDPRVLGSRLQDARRSAGMTQQAVADHLGMARTTVVALEKGERRVSAHDLIQFARLYGRPVSEFTGRRAVSEPFVPQFRVSERELVESDPQFERAALDLQRFGEDYAELQRLTGITVPRSYPPVYETKGAPPEQIASDVAAAERNRLGLGDGPVDNLRERLEADVGLYIVVYEMPSQVAGVFAYNDSLGACVGLNARHPGDRRNWSLAHEYAHFLMTRYQPELTLLAGRKREAAKERLADSFAEHFLMPAAGLNRRFTELQRASEKGATLADICALAELYRVSVQAMVLRLENLRRIPAGTWERLSSEGLQAHEGHKLAGLEPESPAADLLPRRYVVLAIEAYERGELSEGQLARFLRTDRVSVRMEVEMFRGLIHAEREGEFTSLALDLARPLGGH
jgi:Zn-dependent peptidase ImmA (M78 family)/DNA-binding XRE family transcriptional regulator